MQESSLVKRLRDLAKCNLWILAGSRAKLKKNDQITWTISTLTGCLMILKNCLGVQMLFKEIYKESL